MMRKVVYDVDDTLWNLDGTICNILSIDISLIVTYRVFDNPYLTEKQKNDIFSMYGNPDIFKRLEFYPGIERIFDLEKEGKAEVWISSANLNNAVRDIKLRRLMEIPNINKEHIRLTVGKNVHQGRVNGDILIDDSLQNIVDSNFEYNILMDMPHNRDLSMAKDKNIIRVRTLQEAVDIVEKII